MPGLFRRLAWLRRVWPGGGTAARRRTTYLAILELELQDHLGALDGLPDHLGGHPALGSVGLPCPRADVVCFCHGGRRWTAWRPWRGGCTAMGGRRRWAATEAELAAAAERRRTGEARHYYYRQQMRGVAERKDIQED